ncbi:MAG TPA: hypothetical protein PKD05_08925 [Candidatus Melainabacteria bacterium]|nr:hypothetical protein [Candidatus Melainabacteria bacterium]
MVHSSRFAKRSRRGGSQAAAFLALLILFSPLAGYSAESESESGAETKKDETSTPQASPSIEMEQKLESLAKEKADAEEVKKAEEAEKAAMEAAAAGEVGEKSSAPEKKGGSMKLFGRIEQISASGDVKMPVLKAMTAKLDPRGKKVETGVDENVYSGSITQNFPTDFRGQWGGTLVIWSYHYSPLYLQVDRAEAVQTVKILQRGRKGNVNFDFFQDSRGKTTLKPAEVLVSVPMKDTYSYGQMMKGTTDMQKQMAPFNKQFEQVMGNMEAPVVKINFGNFQTDGVTVTGVSGNQARQSVVKNVIRQLAPNVIEQQIVTRSVTKVKGTNKTNTGYAESVLRFKKLSDQKLYVLTASVNYTSSGKYLDKLIMYGTVDRGRLVQTDPMAGLNKMMGGMMNLQGLGNMFGMPTTNSGGKSPFAVPGASGQPVPQGSTQIQGMPEGFNPYDILKRMNQQNK